MPRFIQFQLSSELAASADQLWQHISSMTGVNRELAPWVRMTVPRDVQQLSLADAPVGEMLFRSRLLALGLIPFDVHSLKLERIEAEIGFIEESHTWFHRRWRHERQLVPLARGCCLTDRLEVQPRVRTASVLIAPLVRMLFQHRHQWLRRHFGQA
jgi:ligand-binding SRPBCC domain-containing protein